MVISKWQAASIHHPDGKSGFLSEQSTQNWGYWAVAGGLFSNPVINLNCIWPENLYKPIIRHIIQKTNYISMAMRWQVISDYI